MGYKVKVRLYEPAAAAIDPIEVPGPLYGLSVARIASDALSEALSRPLADPVKNPPHPLGDRDVQSAERAPRTHR